jgi:Domain of unknown function (DUF2017)
VKPFRSTPAGIIAKFDHSDARLLAGLATQIAGLLAERDEHEVDPAIERLLPDAYRDSEADAAEFRRFTEDELADEKIRRALGMAEILEPDTGPETTVRVTLDDASALDWMRSLTDIRLALATRLGIVDDTSPITVDQESQYTLAIYNWLGQLQYSLVKAVDR